MKKISYVLMLLATSILVCGCPADETGHRAVVFINRSGKTIGFQYNYGKVSQIAEDTLFKCNRTTDRIIDNDSSLVIERPKRPSWEVVLGTNDYLELLILDGDQFKKYHRSPCEIIRQNVPILYAYRLTLTELEKMNWVITYTGELE